MLTSQKPAVTVARHAVRIVGRTAEHTPSAGRFVIAHDAVIRDVADEKKAAVGKPYRPLGPAHAGRELLDSAAKEAVFGEARVENLHRGVRVALVRREAER